MKSGLRRKGWRASLLVVALCLAVLNALGCDFGGSAPPKVILDPGMVQDIHIEGAAFPPDVVTDRAIIEKCINEINALEYVAAKRECKGTADIICFRDSAGVPLFEMGIATTYYFELRIPGTRRFRIRDQPIPTIGRLFSYERLRCTVRELQEYASKVNWGERDRVYVASTISLDIERFWPQKAFPAPNGPANLREALNRLPPITLDRLDEFTPFTESR